MSKTAYLYDPETKEFKESFEVDERPEYSHPDMEKGDEFSGIEVPAVGEGERARWDGAKYIIETQYPELLNGTYVPGEAGQVWDVSSWS